MGSPKLIEAALPLEAINIECGRDKSIRHGHPSTMHLWWARRPLAGCRAVVFASLVDDPSAHPERFPTEADQDKERDRLFRILEDLILWENKNNEVVLEAARKEIRASCGDTLPSLFDPFCGGGSIPLEAQRLGLRTRASDLNPVAVLITKATIEIPPRFAGLAPVRTAPKDELQTWVAAQGLAEDVRRFGEVVRDAAREKIGDLFRRPDADDDSEPIAWIWARTISCPNPACGMPLPLVTSFELATTPKRKAHIEPVLNKRAKTISFEVKTSGRAPSPTKVGSRPPKFRCPSCNEVADESYVQQEGVAGRMSARLMAIAMESPTGRRYISGTSADESLAASAKPYWVPDHELPHDPRNIWCVNYGVKRFDQLYTPRQLVALATFSDVVRETRSTIEVAAVAAGLPDDKVPLRDGGRGARAYSDAVCTYLGFAVDRSADYWTSIASWVNGGEFIRNTFARQALGMSWDYAEVNPFSDSTGNFLGAIDWIARVIDAFPRSAVEGSVDQGDARDLNVIPDASHLVCTDPPYFDNISYADLSDCFYVWLRRTLADVYPELLATLLTPKQPELIASPYRFEGGKKAAEQFFEDGLRRAFDEARRIQDPEYPFTLYYAFKQAEKASPDDPALISTGWSTMLEALLGAGFSITGTWPVRSERGARSVAIGTNALASSVVIVCRPRPESAETATRRDLVSALKAELPDALRRLQHGSVAPVDLAQASIGPGMAIFSRYARVIEADGSAMRVRDALALINQALDEILREQEGEFDSETRWAITWFEQNGMRSGSFGDAENLARARAVSIDGLDAAGFIEASAGKVRLLRRDELSADWTPERDSRLTVWEMTQYLAARLLSSGESGAAELLGRLGDAAEAARDLAYLLYSVCDRENWTEEAQPYNALVAAWPELVQLAEPASKQLEL